MTNDSTHDPAERNEGADKTTALQENPPQVCASADRQNIEAALLGSKKFLRTIIDTEPECVKILSADGSLLLMNRAGLDMIQVESLDQARGQCVYPLIQNEYREAFQKLTENVFKGNPGTLTFEMTGVKGRRLWLETHAVPLRNDDDEIIALLGITRDVTERRAAEASLRQEKQFSDGIIDSLPGIFLICDETGKMIRWNDNEKQVTGYSVDELSKMNMLDLFRDDRALVMKKIEEVFSTGHASFEVKITTRSGLLTSILLTAFRMVLGEQRFFVGVGIDISERKKLEEQLRHSQKMECIGTLAGGISHDFNNILTAIIGYGNLLQMKMRPDDPLRHNVEQVLASANRAATLTQGLLAYSRKQILNPKPVNLNEIILKVERLLARLIGEDVELKAILTDKNVTVLADASQLEQVLMNLATNARDAMPEGGNLFIETETVEMDEVSAKAHYFRHAGTYALVVVSDSGMGMDEKTRERIFEPFYTTKEMGKGTGLGLAMVYGIVKQHNGSINVYSEVGRGTTFKIYLPIVAAEDKDVLPVMLPPIEGGTETILVAEDDETVRNFTCTALEQFGYTVIQAVDGEDAVNKFMENRDKVHLLLLDIIMPRKNGKEVHDKIRIFKPGIKALFLSGYTAEIIHQKGLLDKNLNFLLKPVPMNDLLRKVRSVLDEVPSSE